MGFFEKITVAEDEDGKGGGGGGGLESEEVFIGLLTASASSVSSPFGPPPRIS